MPVLEKEGYALHFVVDEEHIYYQQGTKGCTCAGDCKIVNNAVSVD